MGIKDLDDDFFEEEIELQKQTQDDLKEELQTEEKEMNEQQTLQKKLNRMAWYLVVMCICLLVVMGAGTIQERKSIETISECNEKVNELTKEVNYYKSLEPKEPENIVPKFLINYG